MFTAATLFASLLATPALADDTTADTAESTFAVDLEIDPLAYVIGGASLHGGLHVDRVRFDLGVFSLKLPVWLHGNKGFSAQGHGFGFKVDYFAGPRKAGFHAGVQADITNQTVSHDASSESHSYREFATGGRIGFRIQHTSGFYVNPWLGVIYRTNTPTEIDLGGETFAQSAVMPFPTIHVGWRL